jgi:ABC-type glycerol-3-phosphate transport system substrate-binding protein
MKRMRLSVFVICASVMMAATSAPMMAADFPDPQNPCTVTVQFPYVTQPSYNPVSTMIGLWQAGYVLVGILLGAGN